MQIYIIKTYLPNPNPQAEACGYISLCLRHYIIILSIRLLDYIGYIIIPSICQRSYAGTFASVVPKSPVRAAWDYQLLGYIPIILHSACVQPMRGR